MAYERIIYEKAPPIGRIVLNQPEKRNPLGYQRLSEIGVAAKEMERDEDIKVLIVKGAGPCFSAGYDISPVPPGSPQVNFPPDGVYVHPDRDWLWNAYNRQHMDVYFTLWDLQKPVIAQIHSWCLAGGSELAAFCDLRILADNARIGWPVGRDLSPGNLQYMPWMVGITKAKEYMFTAEPMDAEEALRVGWATRIHTLEKLEEETEKLAQKIASVPTDLIMFTKRSINAQFEAMGFRTGLLWGSEMMSLQKYRKSFGEFHRIRDEKGLKSALQQRETERDIY